MNKDCERYYCFIEDLTTGEEIDAVYAAQAESHISSCAECRNEYEFQQQEKEIFAHYLFDFEPPADSWTKLQARMMNEETASGETLVPAGEPRRKRHIFDFGFSPAFAAFTALLVFFGIGFVLLRNADFEKNNFNVAETKPQNSPSTVPQVGSTNQNPTDLQAKERINPDGAAPKNSESRIKNASYNNGETVRRDKKQFISEVVKIKMKATFSGERKKFANENIPVDEVRTARLHRRNFETEIAQQIEKIELLLRSFRNVPLAENAVGFDVEYEKRQARKLLETNAALHRYAKNYGISYAEE